MSKFLFNVTVLILVAPMAGCGFRAAPESSSLMIPLVGKWLFDFDKTLNTMRDPDATDEEFAKFRKYYADGFRDMHPDVTFDGVVVVGDGIPAMEYRFFDLHKHGSQICGKAWHHEDRHDPGDMSKCYVRLEVIDDGPVDALKMEIYMEEDLPNPGDPDLLRPAIEGDAAKCDVKSNTAAHPEYWMTYVFSRGQPEN